VGTAGGKLVSNHCSSSNDLLNKVKYPVETVPSDPVIVIDICHTAFVTNVLFSRTSQHSPLFHNLTANETEE
jgi:hypothetical protein